MMNEQDLEISLEETDALDNEHLTAVVRELHKIIHQDRDTIAEMQREINRLKKQTANLSSRTSGLVRYSANIQI